MYLSRRVLCGCLVIGTPLGFVLYPFAKQKYVEWRMLCRLKCLADITSLYSKERAEIECMPPDRQDGPNGPNIDVPPVPS